MRLKEGDPAPAFQVEDINGNGISLEDYSGRMLLLAFFRYASCPYCNLRISQLIAKYPDLHEQGLDILAFFHSPKKSILRYVGKQKPLFPIVPDSKREVYTLYGVEASWGGFARAVANPKLNYQAMRAGFLPGKMEGKKNLIPADFLIGPDQMIKKAYYGTDLGDHLSIKEIMDFLPLSR